MTGINWIKYIFPHTRLYAYLIRYMLVVFVCICFFTGCEVHEFPEVPATSKLHLKLDFETELPIWEHYYETRLASNSIANTKSVRPYGEMRYIIRAYPISNNQRAGEPFSKEFTFTRDVVNGYDCECDLELAPGNYNIMVWSDLVQHGSDTPFYNVSNFGEISLQGEHQGNNDYRDAFRGKKDISLFADIVERNPDTLSITMQRPLAKYEFITTDIVDFISKEQTRVDAKNNQNPNSKSDSNIETKVNIDDYRVVLYYPGFMPDTYSMFDDITVNSSVGKQFASRITRINDTEASVGFDYVFVNPKDGVVTVKIGIYDKEGIQLSLTEFIDVPLKRNFHTIMRGKFLMSETSGGVSINPDFEGDFNIVIP